MFIDRTHSRSRFSPSELRSLMAEALICAYNGQAPNPAYPYVVFPELSPQWVLADAWHVNALGAKDPTMLLPHPVALSEVHRLDVADVAVRRPLAAYMRRWDRPATFVFSRSGAGSARHNLALGVGHDREEARLDALVRMKVRYPGLKPSVDDFDASPAGLLRDLLSGDATTVFECAGGYPSQEQMGHEYMSMETYNLAQALVSDGALAERIANLEDRSPAGVYRHCRGALAPLGERAELVDWLEIADSFAQPESPSEKAAAAIAMDMEAADLADRVEAQGRRIAPQALAVLARCVTDGNLIRLPAERLDPKLYKQVDEVLRALGGKWVGRKVQAHQFEDDPVAVLEVAVATGSYVKPQDFGFFPTQPDLVERVLALAGIEPGMRLMEPSAGDGAFAVRMAELAGGVEHVKVCELLPGNARKLFEAGFSDVTLGDFLEMEPQPIYDRIVMNPPFNGGVDVDHVLHASRFLKPDGRLVAITGPSWEVNSSRKAEAFREFIEGAEGEVEKVAAGAFKKVGTNVASRIVSIDAENLPWYRAERPVERQRA